MALNGQARWVKVADAWLVLAKVGATPGDVLTVTTKAGKVQQLTVLATAYLGAGPGYDREALYEVEKPAR